MKLGTRTKLAKKLSKFVKTAQAEGPVEPEMLDEAEELPDAEELEEIEDEGDDNDTLESIEEAVEELGETLETVVDALEDQKEVLETTLLDGEVMENKFDDFKDEELEDMEEEFSEEEFGISTEGCDEEEDIKMKSGNLRSRREARLKTAQSKTLSDEFNKPASDKKKYNPIQDTPKITTVKKDEIPEMYKLAELSFERKDDNSAWMVLNAKDEAVFVIPRGNIDGKVFSNDKFANKIIKEMDKHGVLRVLKAYKAKRIVKAKTKAKVDTKTAKAMTNDIRRRFIRAVRLSLTAMNKNLIKNNPLKGALFEMLTDVGVADPMRVIEATFARAGTEHFEVAIAQAEKFMDMTDEAFVEYESQVGESSVNMPPVGGAPKLASLSRAAELSRRAADNSLVFSTSSEFDVDTERAEAIGKALPKPKLYHAIRAAQEQGN